MNRLRWIFELVDRVSGPADAAAASVDKVERSMGRVNATSGATQSRLASLGATFSRITFAVLPTIIALGHIATAIIAVSRAGTMLGVSRASWSVAFAGMKNGASKALAAMKQLGSQGVAALRKIPKQVWAGVAAAAALYVSFRIAKRGAEMLASAVRTVVSSVVIPIGGGGVFAAIAAAAAAATGSIDAMIARDRQLRGLRILAGGDAAEAARQRARFRDMSQFLGISEGDVARGMTELLTKGFSEVEATRIFQGTSDIAAISPSADVGRIILAMSQIRQAGALQGDELNQLAESGLPLTHVYERIAQAMGHVGADSAAWVKAQRGQIPAAVAIEGILAGIQDTTGGILGSVARESSMSLGGMLERIKQAPERFFYSLADGSDAVSERFKAMLGRFLDLLDPSSPAAQGAMTMILDGIDAVGRGIDYAIPKIQEFLRWVQSPEAAAQFAEWKAGAERLWTSLTNIVNTTSSIIDKFGGLGPIVTTVLNSMGAQFDALVTRPLRAMSAMFTAIKNLFTGNFTSWREMGSQLIDALVLGITDMALAPVNALVGVGEAMITGLRGVLDIHSPSRVFRDMGQMTAEGFALGVEDGRQAMIAPPTIGAMGGGPGAGGAFGMGGANISIVVNVSGGSDAQETGEAIGDALAARLLGLWDGFALEAGA